MANVNFFSPDGGTTRYPIEDTEARSRIAGQQNQLNAQGVLGAKNLLKITQNTQTINGVTFTVNMDSDGNVINVTANGTATADATFTLLADYADFEKGDYKITGCPTGGTATTYEIFTAVRHLDATATEFVHDFGNGASLTVDNNTRNIALSIIVRNNTTVSNIVFKPMLRLASDPDDTYQPYAMTNRELTEVKDVTVTAGTNVTLNANTHVSKVGRVVSGRLRLEFTDTLTAQQVLATLSDKPVMDMYTIGIESATNSVMPIIILSNGQVLLFGSNLPTTNNHLLIPVNFIAA